jgi:hypothetical protein
MRLLLVDIVRTALGETWPGVEHSIGLMYVAAILRARFGGRVTVRIHTLVSRPGHDEAERAEIRGILDETEPDVVGVRALSIGKDAIPAASRQPCNGVRIASQWPAGRTPPTPLATPSRARRSTAWSSVRTS